MGAEPGIGMGQDGGTGQADHLMAMTDWYRRQFGDRSSSAMTIALIPDPYPCGPPALDASWGGFDIWARGLCFTRSVSDAGVHRHARLESRSEVEAILSVADLRAPQPLQPPPGALVRPCAPDAREPWNQGNAAAELVRETLGWVDAPLPDLGRRLPQQGCRVETGHHGLPPSISLLTARDDAHALAHVNPVGRSRAHRETGIAPALGHLLLDDTGYAIDGEWEHRPRGPRPRRRRRAPRRDGAPPGRAVHRCVPAEEPGSNLTGRHHGARRSGGVRASRPSVNRRERLGFRLLARSLSEWDERAQFIAALSAGLAEAEAD